MYCGRFSTPGDASCKGSKAVATKTPVAKTPVKALAKPAAKAAPAAPAAPAADGSIPGEIVAAIAAAVASLGENLTIRGIHRVQKKTATGSRRGAWGDAGVTQNTTPFM